MLGSLTSHAWPPGWQPLFRPRSVSSDDDAGAADPAGATSVDGGADLAQPACIAAHNSKTISLIAILASFGLPSRATAESTSEGRSRHVPRAMPPRRRGYEARCPRRSVWGRTGPARATPIRHRVLRFQRRRSRSPAGNFSTDASAHRLTHRATSRLNSSTVSTTSRSA
jgi:hypothetical protein